MQLMVEVPDDVLTSPHLDDPTLDLSRWDRVGVPAGLVLRWLDDAPLTDGTIALLAQIPADELAPNDLPLLVKAWDRVAAHAESRRAAAVAQLTDATRDFRGWDDDDPAPNEIALACRIPLGAAQHEVHRAQRLRAVLPGTRALFDDGRITARHVAKIVAATTTLTPEQCGRVEELALPDAETLSVNEFAFRVRRAVAKVDPKDFDRRHREARLHADVTVDVVDEANAMAWLSAYLPAPQAILIREKVEAHARAVKAGGDKRPLGVLRAEALVAFVDGYGTDTTTADWANTARAVEIRVCATPETLLGLADTPAELPGDCPIPASLIREMASHAKLRWLTYDATNGALLDLDTLTYRPTTWQTRHIHANWVTSAAPHSRIPAERCDLDHHTRHPDGPTSVNNLGPFDRRWHNNKTRRTVTATLQANGTIRWTTPLGQSADVKPYDYRLGP